MPLVNPGIQLSSALPRRVGGAPSAGSYLEQLASAYDHAHPFTETSGPTNLALGGILDGEIPWRVADFLVGRQLDVGRLANNASTSLIALSDVDASWNFALKAPAGYTAIWILHYNTAAVTTGLRLAVNYTGTLNTVRYGIMAATSLTSFQCESTTTVDTPLGQAGVGPGPAANRVALLFADIRTSTAGVAALRFASGVAGSTVTIGANSDAVLIQRV